MTDAFISYAREDSDFVRRVYEDLLKHSRDAWVDWEDIPLTADWLQEAYAGIESANTFIFVISPASIRSGPCTLELEHALQSNKRLIPLLRTEVLDPEEQKLMHASLSSHNWIKVRDVDEYEKAIASVLTALDTDLDYVRAHTRYVIRSSEWESKGHDRSFLLQGSDLSEAENWMKDSLTKQPTANETQRRYILESRVEAKRRRRVLIGTLVVVAIMAFLALAAFLESLQSNKNAEIASANASTARAAESVAEYNADQSESFALAASAQQLLYRDNNTDLAIALALEANRLEQAPPLARTILAQAVYAPGTRQYYSGYALYPAADLSVSPDHQLILAVQGDDTLVLRNLETGETLHSWDFGDTAEQRPWTVDYNPQGWQALVTLGDGRLLVLNLKTYEQSEPFPYEGFIQTAIFTPDGNRILAGYVTGNVVLWDVASGTKLTEYVGSPNVAIYSVALSSDLKMVSAGFDDGSIYIWNFDNAETIKTLTGHTNTVTTVAFSPDNSSLLSGSYDQSVRYWDIETGTEVYRFLEHKDRIRRVIFSPDGSTAFSASFDSLILEWDLNNGKRIQRFAGHLAGVYAVVNMPNNRLLSGSSDGTLRLWDVENGAQIRRFQTENIVYGVAVSPDGTKALSGSQDGIVTLWNLQDGSIIHQMSGHTDGVRGVAFSPDGKRALSGSRDQTMILWDLETGTPLRTFTGHDNTVWGVAFSPDGHTALSGSFDKTMILWDVETGRQIRRFRGHTQRIYNVAFSPDGRFALSASSDKNAILWNVETGEIVQTLKGHQSVVYDVAFSPDGQYALSGSFDKTMILWNLSTGEKLRAFEGHSADVFSVAFSNDGQRALSGSLDGSVRLWNVNTGEELLLYAGHVGGVWDVAFSPDNLTFISGSDDHTVRQWRIETTDEIVLWTYANRYVVDLSCEQRALYRLDTICNSQNIFPTNTPYLTAAPSNTPTPEPTVVTSPTAATATMTLTPTLTPLPALTPGASIHASLLPGNRDLFTFSGKAGDIVTILVKADKPANDVVDEAAKLQQGLLDTAMIVFAPDGSTFADNDDLGDNLTDSLLEGLELPVDGLYVIQVNSAPQLSGGYTVSIVNGLLPTATPTEAPTNTPEPTATETLTPTVTPEPSNTPIPPTAAPSETAAPEASATAS